MIMNSTCICVVGLGYVGLPLAVEFSKHHRVIGFDIDGDRIKDLGNGMDKTGEVSSEVLGDAKGLSFTSDTSEIYDANIYIVTVPTPTDSNNNPVLTPLIKASETVGGVLSRGNYIVYESTVFPGATEEICIPVLEKESKLKLNEDFFVGYSPE